MPDDRLEAVLASVGEHLVVEPGDVTPLVVRRWPRRLLVAAVTVAVIAAAVAAIAPARRAVSGWFGAGRIEVELRRERPNDSGQAVFTDDAARIDPGDAGDVLGAPMPPVGGSDLGPPSEWLAAPEGGVVAGWPDGTTSLWVVSNDGEPALTKEATFDQAVDVTGLGDRAFAISGRHVVMTPYRRVEADTVVVWVDGGLTFRLEGSASIEELVALARQLAKLES